MIRTILNITGFLIITLGSAGLGFLAGRFLIEEKDLEPLPTITEIQERIGAQPDGILGPQTQELWDEAICDQYAKEHFMERQ